MASFELTHHFKGPHSEALGLGFNVNWGHGAGGHNPTITFTQVNYFPLHLKITTFKNHGLNRKYGSVSPSH